MANNQDVEELVRFTEMTVELEKNIFQLCNQTYKATKKPPPYNELCDLIRRAEAKISEYDTLIKQHNGGRREAIIRSGSQVISLRAFTNKLQEIIKKRL